MSNRQQRIKQLFRPIRETYWQLRRAAKTIQMLNSALSSIDQRLSQMEHRVDGLRLLHEYSAKDLTLPPDTDQIDGVIMTSHFPARSSICKSEDFLLPHYGYWCRVLKERPAFHRKQWEWVFICQTFRNFGVLESGRRGLGFGVGREPLAAAFAESGCHILATDGDKGNAIEQGWDVSNQYADSIQALNERNICNAAAFAANVSFQTLDMNYLPDDLQNFDFCWSACALEHLGSIDNGLQFIKNSLKCLKPGGIAVHTTEYNLVSNDETVEGNSFAVLFRRRDLEKLASDLQAEGHIVAPFDFEPGHSPVDHYVDLGPFYFEKSYGKGLPHLKLLLEGFATTSIGLIIQKAA